MSSSIHKSTPKSTGKQSLFFNDLATPVTTRRTGSGKFTTVSSLWRENFQTSDLPPPPIFTLEDRSDFSPDSGIQDYPDHNSNPRSPTRTPSNKLLFSTSPSGSGSSSSKNKTPQSQSWWGGGSEDKGKGLGSPVDGVVNQKGGLLTLPQTREVARPDLKRSLLNVGLVDEEEWVTVYGFSLADTNLVLQEFEKCGVILKHVLGPRDSNWMHILYQSRFDAQKALSKNGMQLNSALIIGVKPVDPMQRQALSDKLHNQGFMPMPPSTTTIRKTDLIGFNASNRAHTQSPHSGGTMASPAKSMVSKIVDLMFGL